jgi:hypothetical protein
LGETIHFRGRDVRAEPTCLADSVHHLAQQVRVGDVVDRLATRLFFLLEFLDLARRYFSEIVRQRLVSVGRIAFERQWRASQQKAEPLVRDGSLASKAAEAVRPCTSATPQKLT